MSQGTLVVPAVRDDAYTASRHLLCGGEVTKSLRKGMEAHVFDDPASLDFLEHQVWTQGFQAPRAGGQPQRSEYDRFLWRSPDPIGRRIQHLKRDALLYWVEVKGKIVNGVWVYHLVPRSKPA